MKTKKSLKFSKETIILLDKTAKKIIKGGSDETATLLDSRDVLCNPNITKKQTYCGPGCW